MRATGERRRGTGACRPGTRSRRSIAGHPARRGPPQPIRGHDILRDCPSAWHHRRRGQAARIPSVRDAPQSAARVLSRRGADQMSPCREIQGGAAYLAALPETDPERELAFEHARSCAACAEALAEGERTIALVDELPPPQRPTVLALKRASEPILRELDAQPARLADARLRPGT